MSADTALSAADAVFKAEHALGKARRLVEELQATVGSALRVLDDAELDSARAGLSDRGSFYLEAAAEHLQRLQGRCADAHHLTNSVYGHLVLATEAAVAVEQALASSEADGPCGVDAGRLRSRMAVLDEVVSIAKPIARIAARHVETAHQASRNVTALGLLEPVSLQRRIATTGKELRSADEDVRLLDTVVGRAAASARESAGIATEMTDNARRRMSEQSREPVPTTSLAAPRSPGR